MPASDAFAGFCPTCVGGYVNAAPPAPPEPQGEPDAHALLAGEWERDYADLKMERDRLRGALGRVAKGRPLQGGCSHGVDGVAFCSWCTMDDPEHADDCPCTIARAALDGRGAP